MYPFWVEISWEEMLQVGTVGLTGLVCLVQSLLFTR